MSIANFQDDSRSCLREVCVTRKALRSTSDYELITSKVAREATRVSLFTGRGLVTCDLLGDGSLNASHLLNSNSTFEPGDVNHHSRW